MKKVKYFIILFSASTYVDNVAYNIVDFRIKHAGDTIYYFLFTIDYFLRIFDQKRW